jgi:hypothetical protein
MVVERSGVICGSNRGAIDAFVRVAWRPDRRIIAVADGHNCPWSSGDSELSGPMLDGIELALARNPTASVESLFDAARAAFLRAAEPYPEDASDGRPAAQLTIAELAPGRLRMWQLGYVDLVIVRGGAVHSQAERRGGGLIERTPRAPSIAELPLLSDELIVMSQRWLSDWVGNAITDIVRQLGSAHREPRRLVEAALARWTDDIRRMQESGELVGEPGVVLVGVCV